MCLIKLVKLGTYSQHRVFPLPCWLQLYMEGFREACTASSSDNFQLVQAYFVTYKKKLEEVDFAHKEFLGKNINNEVYVNYGATEDIPKNACS